MANMLANRLLLLLLFTHKYMIIHLEWFHYETESPNVPNNEYVIMVF